MPSYVTPKKNTAFIIYTSLVSQADTRLFKSTPTLAAGDFKVSIDGAALNNLGTLPTNTPGGVMIKISLASGEMNGDNITVVCSDAAGSEWCDQIINIQTSARQVDDLAWPATTGRSMVVDAAGLVDANMVKAGPTGSGTTQTARDIGASVIAASVTAGVTVTTNNDKTGYTASTVSDKTGYSLSVTPPTAIQVRAEMDSNSTKLANLDATVSSRLAPAGTLATVTNLTNGVTITTNNDKTGYSLTITPATSTDVLNQVNSALDAAGNELATIPNPANATLRQKIQALYQYLFHKRTTTATTETLYKVDGVTTLASSTVSDDSTTATHGKIS